MINLLILTDELNYTDGVTSHLYYLLTELSRGKEISIFLMCSGGDSVEKFENSGIKVFEDGNLSHKRRSIKNFSKIILKLIKFSRVNKINIIHSHNHYAANIANCVSKFTNIKTVQTIHGLIAEGGMLKHFKADKYVAVSEPIVKHLLKNKLSKKENVKLIRQGLPAIYGFSKKMSGEVKIICASRLIKEKGIDNFIKAAKIVKDKYHNEVKFFIAGTGEEEKELKSLSNKLNVEIVFLGNVKNMTEKFMETDIFVLPTRSQSEGFPMSIVEAAFTKNMIIAPRFDWLDGVFKDGTDGLTFKIDNYEELSVRIIFALENPELLNQMSENFRIKATKMFSIKSMTDKHSELYKECLTK